jgi:ParB-like chromosome segregation protein Spo0J
VIDQIPETSVQLSLLVSAFSLREAGTDTRHVQVLAEAASSNVLPPILVQRRSSGIIDGLHRVEVAKLRGEWSIRARVIDCTDEEALILAVKANVGHGLPLSRADRISGAKRIIASHPDWSDRVLARITGLGARTIASIRSIAADTAQPHPKRLGRDGKRRPVVPGEGRRRAVEYIHDHPEAPLREVARAADISIGTAHDLRDKVRRGALHVLPNANEHDAGESGQAPEAEAQGRAWSAIAAKLANDPSVRYTQDGRAFLRWMAMHSAEPNEWSNFIDAIPQHWLGDVRRVAANMTEEWRQFAEQLEYRQSAVGLEYPWTPEIAPIRR